MNDYLLFAKAAMSGEDIEKTVLLMQSLDYAPELVELRKSALLHEARILSLALAMERGEDVEKDADAVQLVNERYAAASVQRPNVMRS